MGIRTKLEPVITQRVEWADTLKAIGIFLVFLGHLQLSNKLVISYIYSFHMPLFFFVSGLFFKYSDVTNGFKSFFIKKLRTRMVPYVLFGILTYCISIMPILLSIFSIYNRSQSIPGDLYTPLVKPLVGMICGTLSDGRFSLTHNVLLWFLTCLLMVEMLFFAITKIAHNKPSTIVLILGLFSILGYLESIYCPIRLPFSTDVALTAVVFYGSSYVLRDKLQPSRLAYVIAVICLPIGLVTCYLNIDYLGIKAIAGRHIQWVAMGHNYYGNIVWFYIAALSNIYLYIHVSKFLQWFGIKHLRYVNFIGENSLIFFLLQYSAFLVVNILLYRVLRMSMYPGEVSVVYGSLVTLVALILLCPVSYIISRYLPFMTGRNTVKLLTRTDVLSCPLESVKDQTA